VNDNLEVYFTFCGRSIPVGASDPSATLTKIPACTEGEVANKRTQMSSYIGYSSGTYTNTAYCENMGSSLSSSQSMTANPGDGGGVVIKLEGGGVLSSWSGCPKTARSTIVNVGCDLNAGDQLSNMKVTRGEGAQWCDIAISAVSRCACKGGCGEAVAPGPAPGPARRGGGKFSPTTRSRVV
jgi:hypothetical protein